MLRQHRAVLDPRVAFFFVVGEERYASVRRDLDERGSRVVPTQPQACEVKRLAALEFLPERRGAFGCLGAGGIVKAAKGRVALDERSRKEVPNGADPGVSRAEFAKRMRHDDGK